MKARPLKELPGFAEALAEFEQREAQEGNRCDYGFRLREIGDIVVPGIHRIWEFTTLRAFARAIADARPPERRLRLVPAPRIAANDCEAP